jgi:hypothetical protein
MTKYIVKIKVTKAVGMKNTVLWHVTSCNRRLQTFRRTVDKLLPDYRCHILEDSKFHGHRSEKLKSHKTNYYFCIISCDTKAQNQF